ncbi:ATP-binding protein [Streptomyces peucetius]|uniref:ATP-binding protein n=1 Tax=Streptomyces peucetius TaxID=1950 RepID=A0ABY6I388_STRPE|nr:ATP-binding protein [Streptomyces peucetius]UYQ60347.1 ATP-binding protein [Streptomyces peucetius]
MKSPPGAPVSGQPERALHVAGARRGFSVCALDGGPQSAGRARKFAVHTLREWALQSVAEDVELVVSELVGNAVRHALPSARPVPDHQPVRLTLLRYTRRLVCAVTDPSPAPPRLRDPGSETAGGRGLILVSALSDTWSWRPAPPRGKTVWASLPLPLPQRHRTL